MVRGALEPVTLTSSSISSCAVFVLTESAVTGCVLMVPADAYVSVATLSTEQTTSRPKQLKSDQPLFPNWWNTSTWRLLNCGLYILNDL